MNYPNFEPVGYQIWPMHQFLRKRSIKKFKRKLRAFKKKIQNR